MRCPPPQHGAVQSGRGAVYDSLLAGNGVGVVPLEAQSRANAWARHNRGLGLMAVLSLPARCQLATGDYPPEFDDQRGHCG